MTATEALQQLLGGTGVTYRFTSPTAVTVGSGGPAGSGALQLDPVQVQGFPVPTQAMIDNLPPPTRADRSQPAASLACSAIAT